MLRLKKSQILIFIKVDPEFKNMFWKMEKCIFFMNKLSPVS